MLNLSRAACFALVALLVVAAPALAGPPLLCHPFDIGSARSLPWDGTNAWWQGRADYNLQNLVTDTEAVLTPSTPVIVRMETLRRAALYASLDEKVAARLLSSSPPVQTRPRRARLGVSALFDAGYLTETYKQNRHAARRASVRRSRPHIAGVIGKADGTPMINRAITLRPDDASLAFCSGAGRRHRRPQRRIAIMRTRRGKAPRRTRCWRGTSTSCRKRSLGPGRSASLAHPWWRFFALPVKKRPEPRFRSPRPTSGISDVLRQTGGPPGRPAKSRAAGCESSINARFSTSAPTAHGLHRRATQPGARSTANGLRA